MKTILALTLAIAFTGCTSGHLGTRTPLQRGDLIMFKGADGTLRANKFRVATMNDLTHRGSVVEITRPTTIVTE